MILCWSWNHFSNFGEFLTLYTLERKSIVQKNFWHHAEKWLRISSLLSKRKTSPKMNHYITTYICIKFRPSCLPYYFDSEFVLHTRKFPEFTTTVWCATLPSKKSGFPKILPSEVHKGKITYCFLYRFWEFEIERRPPYFEVHRLRGRLLTYRVSSTTFDIIQYYFDVDTSDWNPTQPEI